MPKTALTSPMMLMHRLVAMPPVVPLRQAAVSVRAPAADAVAAASAASQAPSPAVAAPAAAQWPRRDECRCDDGPERLPARAARQRW